MPGSAGSNHDVITAATKAGAYYSAPAKTDAGVSAVITRIPQDMWTGIKYP